MPNLISSYADQLHRLVSKLDFDNFKKIQTLLFRTDRTVFILGNGGSQANAGHLALHLMERGVKAFNMLDNPCAMSALSNDCSYEKAPCLMLERLAKKDDILLVISGSGDSVNIIASLARARTLKMITIGLLGMDGGDAIGLCDYAILISEKSYSLIEDLHSVVIHLLGQIE